MSVSFDSQKSLVPSSATNPDAMVAIDHSDMSYDMSCLSHVANDVANRWLLPDGVTDVLFDDAHKQEALRHTLITQLMTHGYQLVSPPLIEYTESLLSNASEDLKRQTFKIIDQVTGRLMGVRADITPQILRIDAHWGGSGIARYCYVGDVIHTLPSGLFGSRTPLQLGAEIFGCASLAADIELVDVLFSLLNTLNMNATLHLDLGHVGLFKRLAEIAELSDIHIEQLMHLYANKNLPELKQVCRLLPMGDDFYALARFGHDMTRLLSALSPRAKQDSHIDTAVNELQRLTTHLQEHWPCSVSIDVTELSGYHYHTGIIFNGYINHETQPLVRGGRFDGLQDAHTQSRAATGFSMDVSRLLAHVAIKKSPVVIIDYKAITNADKHQMQALKQIIHDLREQNHQVIMPLDEQDYPVSVTDKLNLVDGQWQLASV